jgi:hypothetical protein
MQHSDSHNNQSSIVTPTHNNVGVFGTLNDSVGNVIPTLTEILTSNDDGG